MVIRKKGGKTGFWRAFGRFFDEKKAFFLPGGVFFEIPHGIQICEGQNSKKNWAYRGGFHAFFTRKVPLFLGHLFEKCT